MNDRTITRAARHGTKTTPVDTKPRPKRIGDSTRLRPDEIALAMELARADRTEQEIRDYAHMKRTS